MYIFMKREHLTAFRMKFSMFNHGFVALKTQRGYGKTLQFPKAPNCIYRLSTLFPLPVGHFQRVVHVRTYDVILFAYSWI